jgi:intein/homing endonuclease
VKLKITDDKKFLQVTSCTAHEIDQLEYSMTKKVDNYFIIKKKRPNWDGEIRFMDRYQRIPIGLWKEVQEVCTKYHFHLEIEGVDKLFDKTHDFEAFNIWATKYFDESKMTPRDYQLEGANRVIKFKNCTEEISTSGGKTLIAFLVFKYLFDVKDKLKMLYVVPNVNLVTQTEEKFYEYEDSCGKRPNWKSDCAFGGARKTDSADVDIVFGTYQTLSKKDVEYFAQFDAVCIDECLHPDTLITMADFSKKKIKDISLGEKVWTYNEEKKIFEINEVEFVYKNLAQNQQMHEIETEDGSILNITGNHKVLTQESGWVRVDELSGDEEIISFDMMNI